MSLETFTPLELVAIRYTASGAIMLIGALVTKARLPRGRELWYTALFGAITLGVGNGCLSFAEQWIPSGLSALFITTSPFWMLGVEALLPGGAGLHGPTLAGLLVGFCGTLLLAAPSAFGQSFSGPVITGFLVLQFGCAGWALGSIAQRRYPTKAHPIVGGAVQQLATGLVFAIPASLAPSHPIHWSVRGVSAIVYLVVFGSIVGYSSFVYVMEKLPVSVISIYNYINPIVAVFLGWLIYREPFGLRELIAMAVIFAGVALVKRYGAKAPSHEDSKALVHAQE